MDSLEKKIGFLKGLLEGGEDKQTPVGQILSGMLDVLGEIAEKNDTLDEMFSELNDYVESIDDDLSDLEAGQGIGVESDDDSDDDFGDVFPAADQLRLVHAAPPDEELSGGVCPACSFVFFIDGEDSDQYVCPHCEAVVHPLPLTPDNMPVAHKAD